mmetsp:Transcript_30444/g.83934  ORF Transcript_30444/g.83934 Transcript_30444/m.83934 type:complete len:238 (+) Transcript_30444:249-962(+)
MFTVRHWDTKERKSSVISPQCIGGSSPFNITSLTFFLPTMNGSLVRTMKKQQSPDDHTSIRSFHNCPNKTSGAMYNREPRKVNKGAPFSPPTLAALLKSASFNFEAFFWRRRFDGLTSWCMIRFWWRWSMPSISCWESRCACSCDSAPLFSMCDSRLPSSHNSIASHMPELHSKRSSARTIARCSSCRRRLNSVRVIRLTSSFTSVMHFTASKRPSARRRACRTTEKVPKPSSMPNS